jgi:hypothetical protein
MFSRLCLLTVLILPGVFAHAQQAQGDTQPIFEVPQADVYARYRYIDNTSGVVTSDDLQYRFTGRLKLNSRKTGTYAGSRIETGSSIASSWSNSGIGKSPAEWVLNVKTLFVGQRVSKKAEVEIGSMDFEYGAGTEALYADQDSYTEGYRLRIHDLEGKFLPSKVVMHFGYVGDFNKVNTFGRMHRLGEINYVQIVAEKKLAKWMTASAEFDRLRGLNLIRSAGNMTLPDSWLVNDLRIETVARLNDSATAGWALQVVKTKNRLGSFNPGIYYSHLPTGVYRVGTAQALVNGDMYGTGKRIGVTAKRQVTKAFDVSALITRKLESEPGFRWRAQIVGRYQLASVFKWLP